MKVLYLRTVPLASRLIAFLRWQWSLLSLVVSTLLAPPFCAHCGIFLLERQIFCPPCYTTITPIVSLAISLTVRKKMIVHAIGRYEAPLKGLVVAKLNGNIIPARQLGQLITDTPSFNADTFDYIVPIPLHWTRFSSRGFNQAEEMARVISEQCGKPVIHALKRIKNTQFQSSLRRVSRAGNLHDAFALHEIYYAQLHGKRILLIDDLLTTGATLYSAGRTLLSAKPLLIQSFVACRAQ